jgi:DNA-binding MarR family transcriptional regulator
MYLYMQHYAPMNMESNQKKQDNAVIEQIGCECLLSRARILNRVLTGIYDDELRGFGLKATQLNLLVVVARIGPVRRIDIGKRLHLDPSTLTRNLKIMLTNGWIEEIRDGEDGRGSPLQVTAKGRDLLHQIVPSWRKAQDRTHKLIGDNGATLLRKLAANMIGIPSR